MKRIRFIQFIVGITVIFIGFTAFQIPHFTDETVDTWNEEVETMTTTETNEEIIEKIKRAKAEFDELPIDAVIDPVWKGIPGYNGRVVDVEASLKNMEDEERYVEELLVFDEVAPEIGMADLDVTPFYKANPNKPQVAFLINVAWGNEHLPEIINKLNEHDVKATFFLDGSWTKSQPRLARMIQEEGHEIGNHAYNHPDMATLSEEEIKDQLERTNNIIEATLDVTPTWFTPPSGSFNDKVVEIASDMGMYTVLWTVDTIDWQNPSTDTMVERVVTNIHPGATVLMHPTKPTAEGIDEMIVQIREQGLEIAPVSSVMSEQRATGPQIESVEEGEHWFNAKHYRTAFES
ncbi:polysaccharide deacetylase family protein [Geomicrobium sediminis]|uniref:Sporulation protein (Polysaccharide deacetylase family) n=1 Tax=Geomicrobium sediminis TaxID=1347788 RepID=A0ABS2PCW3_9BACL|nr:polysaccharide deacetylase family protein [Geomicrobium sediminis]MBM7632638.1 putative sporulation protein (polysaccharide deacetylase family) [Geomicrobium sediminis]